MTEGPSIDLAGVADELHFAHQQVVNVVALLDEGNTVPFITRYRKERTGNLDEEQIRAIERKVTALRQIAERAATILRLVDAQGKLTPKLRREIEGARSLKRLEDLYLPFRPKRRSRATIARERGLEQFADRIWSQDASLADLDAAAASLVDPAKELPDSAAVLQGAADILAERIHEDADARDAARKVARETGRLVASATGAGQATGQAYRNYFEFSQRAIDIPPHRAMALNRGEKESALKVRFEWDDDKAQAAVAGRSNLDAHRFSAFLSKCLNDALSRLIRPSLERELRRELTERAETHAVSVFARNLRNLLLQPPLPGKKVLALDPGFRTGCKLAVLDECGRSLATDVISITGSAEKKDATKARLATFLAEHECRLIAIGNGTACRETEEIVAETIAEHAPDARYVIVNEAGASIYSTSTVAREEFPELDATVRGTISIGRRVQDPLSELVKIEPQHLGVGMYQHDVSPKLLRDSLEEVVESCVNYVGVDLNTASASLLTYVSGFNQLIARRVVEHREKRGRFDDRRQLRDVPGIGEATFTQAAGFLKIAGGDEPLDGTWIHPESYDAARKILERAPDIPPLAAGGLDVREIAIELGIGEPTCRDILADLARPGRDPRVEMPGPVFKKGILRLEDLREGIELTGTVLNVVDFGAFVDVGLKDSGLVHISRLANRYVASPHDVVAVGDVVTVWVTAIDRERRRISLSMISPEPVGRTFLSGAEPGANSAKPQPAAKPQANGRQKRSEEARDDRESREAAVPAAAPLRGFDELKRAWESRR
ncbi:MAG: Tex family protein [Planctomycetaceae bacterium]